MLANHKFRQGNICHACRFSLKLENSQQYLPLGIWISHQNHPVAVDITAGKPPGNKSGNNRIISYLQLLIIHKYLVISVHVQ